jgi:hypothetical protein
LTFIKASIATCICYVNTPYFLDFELEKYREMEGGRANGLRYLRWGGDGKAVQLEK